MSAQVLGVVLFAALLHALWNAAVKASVKRSLPSSAVFIGAGIVAAFVVPFVPIPERASWPFLAGSVAVHVAYSIMLGKAYRAQAPVALVSALRETSVVFAALLGVVIFKERLGPARIVAIALVLAGIFLMRTS